MDDPVWGNPDHEDQFFMAFKAGFDRRSPHRISDRDLWVLYWEWLLEGRP